MGGNGTSARSQVGPYDGHIVSIHQPLWMKPIVPCTQSCGRGLRWSGAESSPALGRQHLGFFYLFFFTFLFVLPSLESVKSKIPLEAVWSTVACEPPVSFLQKHRVLFGTFGTNRSSKGATFRYFFTSQEETFSSSLTVKTARLDKYNNIPAMTLGYVDGGKHSGGRRAKQQESSADSRMHQSRQVN